MWAGGWNDATGPGRGTATGGERHGRRWKLGRRWAEEQRDRGAGGCGSAGSCALARGAAF